MNITLTFTDYELSEVSWILRDHIWNCENNDQEHCPVQQALDKIYDAINNAERI